MKIKNIHLNKIRNDKRAVSPAISAVIITSAVVMLVLVAVVFANNYLNGRIAENEFAAMKQFMQTVGLDIDDVAWMPGRTQTVRYASKYGQIYFETAVLNYTVYVNKGAGYVYLANYTTGVILFKMPISRYSIGDNYHERIFPLDNSFLQKGTSAPVNNIFVVEKLAMNDGSFIRIVVAPSIRMLNSTIFTGGETINYAKFYLPILNSGNHSYLSQSVTLMGKNVAVKTEGSINSVRIEVSFLKQSLGFDESFFNFRSTVEEIDVMDGSVVEFYTGEVTTSLGLYP